MTGVDISELDAHEQPSDELRAAWKSYSKADQDAILKGNDIDDLSRPEKAAEFVCAGTISRQQLLESFGHILEGEVSSSLVVEKDAPIYYHPILPGKSSMAKYDIAHH
jgi:hypothetical protein